MNTMCQCELRRRAETYVEKQLAAMADRGAPAQITAKEREEMIVAAMRVAGYRGVDTSRELRSRKLV